MKKTSLIPLLLGGWLSLSQPGLAAKEGYYRWQGDDGQLHFTQQPPLGRHYEFIETRTGSAATPPSIEDNEEPMAPRPETNPQNMQILPPKDPSICAKARSNLQSLQLSGARIRATEPDGSSRLLNEEEVKEQRRRAQQAIDIHCK